jgi:protoporphyrinogen oxidase
LNDDEWQRVERRSYFLAAGRLITAPLQYHLGELPEEVLKECIDAYEVRPRMKKEAPSFRDYIVSGFGSVVADRFLIPQNEKTMAVTLDRLSMSAVKRFFPPPNEQRIRAGLALQRPNTVEYNSTFWYPKFGGIDRLVRGLSTGLTQVAVNEEVTALDVDRRELLTRAGHRFTWDVLLSSMPLKTLCALTNDAELQRASARLTHSATISFNFGVRGPLPETLRDAHWIYVPDRDIPFYRFGCYSNISTGMCTPGNSAVYVEAAVPGEQIDRVDIVGELQQKVISALEQFGWIRSADIVCSVTHVIRCAYVHHTPDREAVMDVVRDRLKHYGIYPIGRYGLWDYTGMEDSIVSAFATVKELL